MGVKGMVFGNWLFIWCFSAACFMAGWMGAVFSQESGAPIVVEVFYSKEDPSWKKTEQRIDAVAGALSKLRITKISIDAADGYARLLAAEKRLGIKRPGEITLIMGKHYLINKGERKEIEAYFRSSAQRMLEPEKIKGRTPSEAQDRVKAFAVEAFGKDIEISRVPAGVDKSVHLKLFRVSQGGKSKGWVADAFHHIQCPVCNDVQFLAAVEPDEIQIKRIKPVRRLERWGRPLDGKEQERFLGQFKALKAKQIAKEGIRVDGISGATKTSNAYRSMATEILKAVSRAGSLKEESEK